MGLSVPPAIRKEALITNRSSRQEVTEHHHGRTYVRRRPCIRQFDQWCTGRPVRLVDDQDCVASPPHTTTTPIVVMFGGSQEQHRQRPNRGTSRARPWPRSGFECAGGGSARAHRRITAKAREPRRIIIGTGPAQIANAGTARHRPGSKCPRGWIRARAEKVSQR